MSFALFTDSFSNLPRAVLTKRNIRVLKGSYLMDGELTECPEAGDEFDAHEFYEKLRSGSVASTSMLNMFTFMEAFQEALDEGLDVVYVGLSSGVSGTLQAANMAAEELLEEYPDRVIRVVDSKGAGLGVGILTCRGADLRSSGMGANQVADELERMRDGLCEYFTVDNLMFLKRTGRISAASALAGTMLQIKPLLFGDDEGHIVACGKHLGRKNVIEAMIQKLTEKIRHSDLVAISHGDCPEDALCLARKVRELVNPRELIVCAHEPFTGSHVGPGMLGLFFFGDRR